MQFGVQAALPEKYVCAEKLLPQRRKGAKKSFRNAAALCVFAGRLPNKRNFSGKASSSFSLLVKQQLKG
jgi:hypothetical protein